MKRVLVIDGQGGRIGAAVIEEIKKSNFDIELVAIGTNSMATLAMMKAGGIKGATGENAVVVNSRKADVIIGPIGIVIVDALLGEVTEKMAKAVGTSSATKLLIPINHCENIVVGIKDFSISTIKESVVESLRTALK